MGYFRPEKLHCAGKATSLGHSDGEDADAEKRLLESSSSCSWKQTVAAPRDFATACIPSTDVCTSRRYANVPEGPNVKASAVSFMAAVAPLVKMTLYLVESVLKN